ncbi:GIY-YIG nuclease family protein [Flaviaesturariibacter aridisoli]|uniref:GIY-YIG nuclease family protein n=1 Tax=Flaviaesturariibacter aridisoli TaxID=2545761 RepID=A0A4R4E390_9BACT|nr:GIY-YIG nuclease family protein [Flaviaesturariibacter aridisoli]TCZ73387.1 GIY-YIG nuclease family protein [Flaviaesturariibacter aridisoli]
MIYGGFVYILTCNSRKALYVGVTANLGARLAEHRSAKPRTSFTARYNTHTLVYYRVFDRIEDAIAEEKRLKGGSRAQKIRLVEAMNPGWDDLWETRLKPGRQPGPQAR